MHGHQLHGVVRDFFFQANVAAGFVEIGEVFDEIAELLFLALALPFLHESDEAIEVVAILVGRQRRDAQAGDQFVHDFRSGASPRGLPQAAPSNCTNSLSFTPARLKGASFCAVSSSSLSGRR